VISELTKQEQSTFIAATNAINCQLDFIHWYVNRYNFNKYSTNYPPNTCIVQVPLLLYNKNGNLYPNVVHTLPKHVIYVAYLTGLQVCLLQIQTLCYKVTVQISHYTISYQKFSLTHANNL
jgi:hypothetical protein